MGSWWRLPFQQCSPSLFGRSEGFESIQLLEAGIGCFEAFVVGRFAIQFIAHGDFTVSLFGNLYFVALKPPHATVPLQWSAKAPSQPAAVWGLGHFVWHFLRGHLAYLGLLFWPAFVLGVWPAQDAKAGRGRDSYALLLTFSFVTLFLLVAMAVKIGVDLAAIFEVEICRLHGRYYNFVFPGLVLLFLAGTHGIARGPTILASSRR